MEPFTLHKPDIIENGVIYSCPHSGTFFPDDFLNSINVDLEVLLKSGDSFVDQLFADVTQAGSPLFANTYGRSYLDSSRAENELDMTMFSGMKIAKNARISDKTSRGFGLIAQKTYDGQQIYSQKLPFAEAEKRLKNIYRPVHQALQGLILEIHQQHGYSCLVDCHSMPSFDFIGLRFIHQRQPDVILGNCFNKSCDAELSEYIARFFHKAGLSVSFNTPYAGGFNTSHYGNPSVGQHAIQIELNRALYMDEDNLTLSPDFPELRLLIKQLSQNLNQDIKAILDP